MADPTTTSRRRVSPVRLLVTALILCAAAVTIYLVFPRKLLQAKKGPSDELMVRMTGLERGVRNRMSEQFRDADGDLVADAPETPGEQIDPPTIYFSYIGEEDPEPSRLAWSEFVEHLSSRLGRPVEYATFTSTDDQLRALAEGRLHVTGLNTGNVPAAVNLCGFVPVARVAGADGKGTYRMQIIVPADSAIKSPADLMGHELVLTQVGSNSGYRAPLVVLKNDFDLLPGRDYTIRYSGDHAASIDGIAAKRYEAAAVASDMLDRATGAGRITPGQFRAIYTSEDFPSACLGHVWNLKPELAEKVRATLLDFDWKGTRLESYFAASGQTKLVPVNYKNDWALVRRTDDAAGYAYQLRELAPLPATEPSTLPADNGSAQPPEPEPDSTERDDRRRR